VHWRGQSRSCHASVAVVGLDSQLVDEFEELVLLGEQLAGSLATTLEGA